jgi:hypothetical protein
MPGDSRRVNSYVERVGALAAARRRAISCSRSWQLQRVTTTSRHQPIKLIAKVHDQGLCISSEGAALKTPNTLFIWEFLGLTRAVENHRSALRTPTFARANTSSSHHRLFVGARQRTLLLPKPLSTLSTPISDASLSSASSSVRTTIASARRFIMNNFVGSEWTSQLFFLLRQVASRGNIIFGFDDFFYLCRRESVRI